METPRLQRLAAQVVRPGTHSGVAQRGWGSAAAATTEMSPCTSSPELPLSDAQVRQFAADVRCAHTHLETSIVAMTQP